MYGRYDNFTVSCLRVDPQDELFSNNSTIKPGKPISTLMEDKHLYWVKANFSDWMLMFRLHIQLMSDELEKGLWFHITGNTESIEAFLLNNFLCGQFITCICHRLVRSLVWYCWDSVLPSNTTWNITHILVLIWEDCGLMAAICSHLRVTRGPF